MKKEELQLTPQKYKGLYKTTISNYVQLYGCIKWTVQKKWTNSSKGTTFQIYTRKKQKI